MNTDDCSLPRKPSDNCRTSSTAKIQASARYAHVIRLDIKMAPVHWLTIVRLLQQEKMKRQYEEEMKLRYMSNTDTPLGTLAKLQEKTKMQQSPFIVLSGKKGLIKYVLLSTRTPSFSIGHFGILIC